MPVLQKQNGISIMYTHPSLASVCEPKKYGINTIYTHPSLTSAGVSQNQKYGIGIMYTHPPLTRACAPKKAKFHLPLDADTTTFSDGIVRTT